MWEVVYERCLSGVLPLSAVFVLVATGSPVDRGAACGVSLPGGPGWVGVLPEPVVWRGATWASSTALDVGERMRTPLNGAALTSVFGVCAGQGVAVDRVHTEEVTGSIPVSPTRNAYPTRPTSPVNPLVRPRLTGGSHEVVSRL